jgi:hypothetical protein
VRLILGLALVSGVAHAGAVYEFTHRAFALPPSAPAIAHYVVQDDKVRVAGSDGTLVFIFKDQTIYIINTTSRSVDAQKYATLSQIEAKYAELEKQIQDAAASAPADKRAMLGQVARDTKETQQRQSHPVPRDYRVTDRSESVDGHSCRIWEEREAGARRLELCVAPVTEIAGGADILGGMKSLSQYYQGSTFALGVQFGPAPWWSGMETLGGVPILIREFKDDKAIGETTLTAIHPEVPSPSLFDLPEGYPIREQPLGSP